MELLDWKDTIVPMCYCLFQRLRLSTYLVERQYVMGLVVVKGARMV